MTTVTPNLKLNVPAFDQSPWDTDVDQNWSILDATIGQFFGVANFVGVWLNAHSYLVGQTTVDGVDSSMWLCLVTHTSATSPTTFAADRIAHPTYWRQTGATAAASAAAAASSASASAASAATASLQASNAANSASSAASSATTASGFATSAVLKVGGTMTGLLTLSGDPAIALQAATKQYVDARVGGTGFLPTTGGTLTGFLTLNADPTNPLHASTKQYVDSHIASNIANYLPLSGGTVSGNVTVTGNSGAGAFTFTTGGGYLTANATNTLFVFDSAAWYLGWGRSTGQLSYVRGSDSVVLWYTTSTGNMFAAGQVSAGTNVVSAGNHFNRGRTYYFGATDGCYLSTDDATITDLQFQSTGWRLRWLWSDGSLNFYNSTNTNLFRVGGNGDVSIVGNTTIAGGVSGVVHYIGAYGSNFYLQQLSTQYLINFTPGYYLGWVTANGTLQYVLNNVTAFNLDAITGRFNVLIAEVTGHGAYINTSDERRKQDIVESKIGLDEIMQIKPIHFRRSEDREEELGFGARQLQPIMPHAVKKLDEETLGVASEAIVAALVNAVKTLEARISTLEAR